MGGPVKEIFVKLSRPKRRFFILVVALLVAGLYSKYPGLLHGDYADNNIAGQQSAITAAYRARKSNVQVSGKGVVTRVLPDDLQGIRHQKFILQLPSGQSLLVAHNIDLAPRIQGLRKGDRVSFAGEYEWNNRGGVLHWTHKDPHGHHADGWLRRGGTLYQ